MLPGPLDSGEISNNSMFERNVKHREKVTRQTKLSDKFEVIQVKRSVSFILKVVQPINLIVKLFNLLNIQQCVYICLK